MSWLAAHLECISAREGDTGCAGSRSLDSDSCSLNLGPVLQLPGAHDPNELDEGEVWEDARTSMGSMEEARPATPDAELRSSPVQDLSDGGTRVPIQPAFDMFAAQVCAPHSCRA